MQPPKSCKWCSSGSSEHYAAEVDQCLFAGHASKNLSLGAGPPSSIAHFFPEDATLRCDQLSHSLGKLLRSDALDAGPPRWAEVEIESELPMPQIWMFIYFGPRVAGIFS